MSTLENKLKVVVGLGNPGPKYKDTRHNIGFEVVEEFARRQTAEAARSKFEGEISHCQVGNTKLVLVRPQTYMNLSGRCVSAVAKFYKIDPEQDLIIVCDDISLPLGKIRIRQKGSAGGQKGLKHIQQSLGTEAIARLRIGIDLPPPQWDAADYVLGRFRADERECVTQAVESACEAIVDWCQYDIDHCMNRFN